MYKFSTSSKNKLKKALPVIELINDKAIQLSDIDYGISHTHRSVQEQNKLFREGLSKIDGITKKSKHNYDPSHAWDIVAYVDGKVTWEKHYYVYLAGIIMATAREMGIKIRWGGNFDMDGDILEQDFNDLCHFEIIDKRFI